MTGLTRADRPAVVLTALMSVPIVAGLLTAAVHAASTAEAVVIAATLVVWLALALPVAVGVGRMVPRDIPTGPDEHRETS